MPGEESGEGGRSTVPEYLKDYITRSTRAMEDISVTMETQGDRFVQIIKEMNVREDRWADLITTLNKDFALHDEGIQKKFDALCTEIGAFTKEASTFRTETWDWAKKLIGKFALILAALVGGIEVVKALVGG
jgi:hypothetical protein